MNWFSIFFSVADKTSSSKSSDAPSWLFSFGASEVKAKVTRQGRINFVVDPKTSSDMTGFTDRPDRLTGKMKIKSFARKFDEFFGDDKPNASMTYWNKSGDFNNHVYEIEGIRKEKGRYHIKTSLLEEDLYQTTSNQSDSDGSDKSSIADSFSINQANFFIDSTPLSNTGCNTDPISPEQCEACSEFEFRSDAWTACVYAYYYSIAGVLSLV